MIKYILSLCLMILPVAAAPSLVIDASTGDILHQEEAGSPWMPASLTKMMTAYVTLSAIREGKITHDHALRVSVKAQKQAPSKMGFKAGSLITVDNALKIIMVKSANDVSMTIAEGVSGSLENFVSDMNARASDLGMTGTRFVNANGLPANGQVTTARDMALLAYALLHQFPDSRDLWDIPSLLHGTKIIRNTNHLIGRFHGIMGMKTGFICASGFNVVAVAQRNGRTLIAVVLGSHSARERAEKAAGLFEKTFSGRSTGQKLTSILNSGGSAPNIRGQVCVRGGKTYVPLGESEDFDAEVTLSNPESSGSPSDFFRREAERANRKPNGVLTAYAPTRSPEPIFTGAKPGGPSDVRGPIVAQKLAKKKVAIKPNDPKKAVVKKLEPKKVDVKKPVVKKPAPKKPEIKKNKEKAKQ